MEKEFTFEDVKACESCYNCRYWDVDFSVMGQYQYNLCTKNDTSEPFTSPSWYCSKFETRTMETLLPNIFNSQKSEDNKGGYNNEKDCHI